VTVETVGPTVSGTEALEVIAEARSPEEALKLCVALRERAAKASSAPNQNT
jgi:hypothetical protein